MKISPYTIYLEMQPNALLVRQNFIICKKWVLQFGIPMGGAGRVDSLQIRLVGNEWVKEWTLLRTRLRKRGAFGDLD
jgi:hypothetical protein